MDWEIEIPFFLVDVQMLDNVLSFFVAIIWLSICEKEHCCFVERSGRAVSVHDQVNALFKSLINIGTIPLSDLIYELQKFFAICIKELGEVVRNLNLVVKQNYRDAVLRPHRVNDGLDCMLHKIQKGIAQVLVLSFTVRLASRRSAH